MFFVNKSKINICLLWIISGEDNMNKRIEWIDILKGIGIIFVLLGHMPSLPIIIQLWIFSFHMPLFFFASGYLFTKRDILVQVIKKAKSLLIPYFIFSFVFLLLDLILFKNIDDLKSNIINTLTGQGGFGMLWFFVSLFLVECIFNAIVNKFSTRMSAVLIVLLVCGGYFLCLLKMGNIFKISTSLVSLSFLGIGYLLVKLVDIKKLFENRYSLVLAIILNVLFCSLNINFFGNTIDINNMIYGNIIFAIISAVSGIYIIAYVSYYLINYKVSNSIQYIGRYSLWFFPMTGYIPITLVSILETYTNVNANIGIKVIAKGIGFAITILIIEFKPKLKILKNRYLDN